MPGTRALAAQYGLSRGTIVTAFEQLQSEGYVDGSVGSGTYVSTVLPDSLFKVGRNADATPRVPAPPRRRLSTFGKRVTLFPGYEARRSRAFRANLPALDLFPVAEWAQIESRRTRRASVSQLLGCEPMGYLPLREAVSDYLTTSRGVRCSPGQVAIVSGVQHALDLVARLFVTAGDRVGMEEPGYVGAAVVFEAAGAKIVAVPLDDEGLDVRHRGLRGARLVYVTPAHQFPLGTTMSLSRRLQLLEWARSSGALDLRGRLRQRIPLLGKSHSGDAGSRPAGSVIFAGTFSKVLFPSLRLGYLVVPEDLVPCVEAALSVTSRHAPLLEQAVLCDFIVGGHFGRHLRRMRSIYAERLSVLLDSARRELAGLLDVSNVEAGLQTVGWLCGGMDGESAAQAAAGRGVEVTPLAVIAALADATRRAPNSELRLHRSTLGVVGHPAAGSVVMRLGPSIRWARGCISHVERRRRATTAASYGRGRPERRRPLAIAYASPRPNAVGKTTSRAVSHCWNAR